MGKKNKKSKRQKKCIPQRLVHTKVIRLMTGNNEPMKCTAVLRLLTVSLSVGKSEALTRGA